MATAKSKKQNSKVKSAKKTPAKKTVSAKAKPAKKPAPKKVSKPVSKAAPKKAAVKAKPAKKAAASVKKPTSKAPAKKTAPAKKPAPARKAAAVVKKQVPAKKVSKPSKAAVKKPIPAKASKPAQKVAAAKTSAKGKAAPKTGGDKAASKKLGSDDIKEILSKKFVSRKSKKNPRAQQSEEASASVKGSRPSAGIYFSIEDLDSLLAGGGMTKNEEKPSGQASVSRSDKKAPAKAPAPKAPAAPKRPLAPASIADILGFNPITESRSKYEEKDVPQKWLKYYKLLMEIKSRFDGVADDMADAIAPARDELTHENANQGMDAADIGSQNFEHDMAVSLLSSEQAILNEVDAAIERMKNGTYGVCEVTGKPIPDSRLTALPFARCTIEGQRIKEAEQKRQRAGQQRNVYGDIADDIELETLEEAEE